MLRWGMWAGVLVSACGKGPDLGSEGRGGPSSSCAPTLEICDGIDNDCDGAVDVSAYDAVLWYADEDEDGHGNADRSDQACGAIPGHVASADDCDDTDPLVHPGASERCNDLDDDCDDVIDEDADPSRTLYPDEDDDGFGADEGYVAGCVLEGFVPRSGDCDDADPARHPDAVEICYDGKDQNCDERSDYDCDLDGHDALAYGGTDCDDQADEVHVGAHERCDEVDNDCDGVPWIPGTAGFTTWSDGSYLDLSEGIPGPPAQVFSPPEPGTVTCCEGHFTFAIDGPLGVDFDLVGLGGRDQVILAPEDIGRGPVVGVNGSTHHVVRGVTLVGDREDLIGDYTGTGGSLRVEDSALQGGGIESAAERLEVRTTTIEVRGNGIRFSGGSLEIHDVSIDNRGLAGESVFTNHGDLVVRNLRSNGGSSAVIRGAPEYVDVVGLVVVDGAGLDLESAEVKMEDVTMVGGQGLVLDGVDTATLARLTFEDIVGAPVSITGRTATLTDVTLTGGSTQGVVVNLSGTGDLRDVDLRGSGPGLWLSGTGTTRLSDARLTMADNALRVTGGAAELTDLVIEGSKADPTLLATAIEILNATVTCERCDVSGYDPAGPSWTLIDVEAARLTLVESLIHDNTMRHSLMGVGPDGDVRCVGSSDTTAGFVRNTTPANAMAYLVTSATGLVSESCDWGEGPDDNAVVDVEVQQAGTWSFGNDASFTCTDAGC